jgi:hypothetical protein
MYIGLLQTGQFKAGKLHGKGYWQENDWWSGAKPPSRKPQRIIDGIFENGVCTDGTKTTFSADLKNEFHITGKGVEDKLLSGWVIKDYEGYKNVKPHRALYIGGILVAVLPGTEISTNIKKIELGKGIAYTGEVDDSGKPYGFGLIEYPGYTYEGMVDNSLPNGYGYYYSNQNKNANLQTGGWYRNGKIIRGAVLKPKYSERILMKFGTDNLKDKDYNKDPEYNFATGDIRQGKFNLTLFDEKGLKSREENGYMVNGRVENNYVSYGITEEERKRQRVVKNGKINSVDVVVGDVVVIDGYAIIRTSAFRFLYGLQYMQWCGFYFIQLPAASAAGNRELS